MVYYQEICHYTIKGISINICGLVCTRQRRLWSIQCSKLALSVFTIRLNILRRQLIWSLSEEMVYVQEWSIVQQN